MLDSVVMGALRRFPRIHRAGLVGGVLLLAACSSDARLAEIERRLDRIESAAHAVPPVSSHEQPSQRAPARIDDAFDKGWILVGEGADYYGVTRDPEMRRDGRAPVVLAPDGQTFGKDATWTTSVDASPYRGKRVRMTIWTKTNDVANAAFCARSQASDSPHRSVALAERSITLPENAGWEERTIVMDVDPQADQIQFGIDLLFQRSDARVWVDEPKIEVVTTEVPPTPQFEGEKHLGDWLLTGWGASAASAGTGPPDPESVGVAIVEPRGREIHVVRALSAEGFAGKTVHVAFDVRTNKLEGVGWCELFVQRSRDIRHAWKTVADRKDLPATSRGYTHCDLVAQVPEKWKWLIFGARLEGRGELWVKGGTVTMSAAPSPKSLTL